MGVVGPNTGKTKQIYTSRSCNILTCLPLLSFKPIQRNGPTYGQHKKHTLLVFSYLSKSSKLVYNASGRLRERPTPSINFHTPIVQQKGYVGLSPPRRVKAWGQTRILDYGPGACGRTQILDYGPRPRVGRSGRVPGASQTL